MSKPIYPEIIVETFDEIPETRTNITDYEAGKEKRVNLWGNARKMHFRLAHVNLYLSEKQTLLDFFDARNGQTEDFYLKNINNFEIIGEVLGTAPASVVPQVFNFQTVKTYIIAGTSIVYVGGVPTAHTIDNDTGAGSVTVPASPTPTVIIADYDFYYLARFEDDRLVVTRNAEAKNLYNVSANLVEVWR